MFRTRLLLALVLLVFLGTRLWLLLAFEAEMPDTSYYAVLAAQGVDLKHVAYRDFKVEYPPVAWWLIAGARKLDSEPPLNPKATPAEFKAFVQRYSSRYHAELFLADTICFGLMLLIGRIVLPTRQWVLPAAYTLVTIAQPHLIYDRLDTVLLMFFLLFVYGWLRSLENSRAANLWATASYLFLGLGISFKIVPVIFVPFLLLADVWASGSVLRFAGRFLALAVGTLVPFLVYIPSAGWGVATLFQYHSERGTHLESIWSSIMLVAAKFGVPCSTYNSYGGWNLAGDWSTPLKTVSSVAMVASAAAVGLWALLRGNRFDRRLALDTAILVLVNTSVLSHVYSPQYLIWLMPLALLLAINIFPRHWTIWLAFAVLAVAIVGISGWLFPYLYPALIKLQWLPVVLTITRSVCLVLFALLMNIPFFVKYGFIPWRAGKPAPDALALAA